MKKSLIYFIILFLAVVGSYAYFVIANQENPKDRRLTYSQELTQEEFKKMKQENEEARKRFPETVRRLNEGWDNIGLGDSYQRQGKYDEAILAYKKAYEVDPRNGLMSGKILIELYEKLSRYDEAMAMVDEILKNQTLAPIGVERYSAIRLRLQEAKTKSHLPSTSTESRPKE